MCVRARRQLLGVGSVFLHVDFRDGTQVVRLSGKCLCPVRCLTKPGKVILDLPLIKCITVKLQNMKLQKIKNIRSIGKVFMITEAKRRSKLVPRLNIYRKVLSVQDFPILLIL